MQTHIPIFSIHVSPYTPPGRTIAQLDTWMKPEGSNKSLCYDVSTPSVSSAARNALGLTGFGSFNPQSYPDMIGLYVAEGSSGPPRKKRGLCRMTQPLYCFETVFGIGKNISDNNTKVKHFWTVKKITEIQNFISLFQIKCRGAVRGRFEFLDQKAVLIIGPPGGTDLSPNEASPTVW